MNYRIYEQVRLGLCSVVGVWYILKKHWLANDLLGMAFAINGVELLHLNNVVTGCILLGGLFFYDIFWVFGTDVMVTVAKSFEAPIKLVFPQVLLFQLWFHRNLMFRICWRTDRWAPQTSSYSVLETLRHLASSSPSFSGWRF